MGVESKHSYRFDFLKSEEWATIRADVLARESGLCFICKANDTMNDVHHMFYRRHWRDTKSSDCHVLCRRCHEIVHEMMDKDELKDMSANELRKAFKVLVSVVKTSLNIPQLFEYRKKKPADYLREKLSSLQSEVDHLKKERDALKKEVNMLRELIPFDWSDWSI